MKYTEILEKVVDITKEVEVYKLEILFYEATEHGETFETTIKIDRNAC